MVQVNGKNFYVVGFAFGPGKRVALIRKTKPAWQAGKLNGVGGKVESSDPSAYFAMAREFEEETSVKTQPEDWRLYLEIETDVSRVAFFSMMLTKEQFKNLKTTTDEQVLARFCDTLDWQEVLPNLRWSLPMATIANAIDGVVKVYEKSDVVTT